MAAAAYQVRIRSATEAEVLVECWTARERWRLEAGDGEKFRRKDGRGARACRTTGVRKNRVRRRVQRSRKRRMDESRKSWNFWGCECTCTCNALLGGLATRLQDKRRTANVDAS
jgi:hypothetical protein